MIVSNPVVSTHDEHASKLVKEELQHIRALLTQGYETSYGALHAPLDIHAITQVRTLVEVLERSDPQLLLLVGIGGSSLGTLAVLDAVGGTCRESIAVDTLDEKELTSALTACEQRLSSGQKIILCIVTKSGTTAETMINGAFFLELLKKFHPQDYQQYCVCITDIGSSLYITAQQEGFHLLTIPTAVGGRYSVFTPVGLFPLMMLGCDVEQLCKGAEQALGACLDESLEVNEAAQTALMLYAHYKKGYRQHALFVFNQSCVALAEWYKQLIGESLGKQTDRLGNSVEMGFTPFVSCGTQDLHSVVQVYLAGPRTMMTTFILDTDHPDTGSIPDNVLSSLVPGMANRTLSSVKSAIVEGTIAAFKKQQRPTLVTHLEQTSFSIGYFLIAKMIETMLLGKLFNIDPFDQPAVELYKHETRLILSKQP